MPGKGQYTKRVELKCQDCGKKFWRHESWIKKCLGKTFTCSMACKGLLQTKISRSLWKEIGQDYKLGMSANAIGKKYGGVRHENIFRILKRLKIPVRKDRWFYIAGSKNKNWKGGYKHSDGYKMHRIRGRYIM